MASKKDFQNMLLHENKQEQYLDSEHRAYKTAKWHFYHKPYAVDGETIKEEENDRYTESC